VEGGVFAMKVVVSEQGLAALVGEVVGGQQDVPVGGVEVLVVEQFDDFVAVLRYEVGLCLCL